jgi:hypothetical protein
MDRYQRVASLPVESSSEEEDNGWLAFAGGAVANCHELMATTILQLQNSDVGSSSSVDDLQEGTRKRKKKIVWNYTRAH